MAGLTCSANCAKLILFAITLFVALAGIASLGCGIWFVSDPDSVRLLEVTADNTYYQLIRASGGILIGVGILLIIIGVAGCWGAIAEKTGCLTCYQAILIILIIMQIVATVLAGVFHSEINNGLMKSMTASLSKDYGNPNKQAVTEGWNFMQYELACCGVNNYSDWSSSWWKSNTTSEDLVPATCCKLNSTDFLVPYPENRAQCNSEARGESPNYSQLHPEGCYGKFNSWFTSSWGILIGIVVAVILIQVIGIVLSCCVSSSIKKGYEYV